MCRAGFTPCRVPTQFGSRAPESSFKRNTVCQLPTPLTCPEGPSNTGSPPQGSRPLSSMLPPALIMCHVCGWSCCFMPERATLQQLLHDKGLSIGRACTPRHAQAGGGPGCLQLCRRGLSACSAHQTGCEPCTAGVWLTGLREGCLGQVHRAVASTEAQPAPGTACA